MRTTLIAIQKNEGMFLLEWIAHNLAIGFDHIVVATNDCQDGSDALLDALGRHVPVSRLDNDTRVPGETIQETGTAMCLAHPRAQSADWVMHMDVDEFLDVDAPVPMVADRYADADAVAFLWKAFGNDDRTVWDGGWVTDAFRRAAKSPTDQVTAHKTLFRPGSFGATSPHMPKKPTKPADDLRVVNTRGALLPNRRHYTGRTGYRLEPEDLTWEGGCVNHYQIKSLDLSLMKVARGAPNGGSDNRRKPGNPAFEKFNRNDRDDYQIDRSRPGRLRLFGELMAHPEIAELHENCMIWFFRERRRLLASPTRMRVA